MWLLVGDLHERCIAADGPPTALTILLRPDRTYRFGRQHKDAHNHFGWLDPKSASRKHVEISCSPTSKTHIRVAQDQVEPLYTLVVKNLTKKSWPVKRADGSESSIEAEASFDVQDGDSITFAAPHREARFIWQPLDIVYGISRKVEDVAQFAIENGCRYIEAKNFTDTTLTHFITKVVVMKVNVANALIAGGHLVSADWFHRLQHVLKSRSELPADDPHYAADDQLSALERDFTANWPAEADFLPEGQADDEYGERESAKFAGNAARRTIFQGTLMVDLADTEMSKGWLAVLQHAGAVVMSFPMVEPRDKADWAQRLVTAVEATVKESNLPANTRIYFYKVGEPPEADMMKIKRAAHGCGAVGLINTGDIVEAIYQTDASKMRVDADYSEAEKSAAAGKQPRTLAPSSSANVGCADVADYRRVLAPPSSALNLDGAPASSEATQGADAANGLGPTPADGHHRKESDESMAPPPPKKKLIRRAGQKNSLLDDLFGEDMPSQSQFEQSTSTSRAGLGQTQASSQAGGDASQSIPGSSSAQGGTSRTAGLKRRAGRTHNYEFEFDIAAPAPTGLPEAGPSSSVVPMQVGNEASKDATQVPAKRKAATQAASDEVQAANDAKRGAKGKKAEAQPPKKKTKKGAAQEAEEEEKKKAAEKAKYLQVDRGKRKVTQEEAELNKEFNELKIVRPVLTAPKVVRGHQVGWRERDLDEEDLEGLKDWRPDPTTSFFNIIRAALGRSRPAPPSEQTYELPVQWRGCPNFKAFRPKNSSPPSRPKRQNVELVLAAAADFGLEKLDKDADGRMSHLESEDEMFSQSALPFGRSGTAKKTKGKGKRLAIVSEEDDSMDDGGRISSTSTATARSGKTARSTKSKEKRPPIIEEDIEAEGSDAWKLEDSDEEPAPSRRKAADAKSKRGTQSQMVELSGDEMTFGGFATASKRKRGR